VTYTVKEIFKTLQGEGVHTGRVAVFCRFAGCNLWSGREQDRATAQCQFCDTDFVDGTKYKTAKALVDAVATEWGESVLHRMVVLTGGEPALQYDKDLRDEFRKRMFYVAIETNGTVPIRARPDWICVSPKANTELKVLDADELKIVFPQAGIDPSALRFRFNVTHCSIQPMDGTDREANTQYAIAFCLANPEWRLSLQTHKWTGIR
jgi:7-carboxy-7-deazaguanine synthase